MLVRETATTNKRTLPLMILNGVYLGGIVFILSEFHQHIFTSSIAVFLLGLTVLFISLGGIVKIVRGLAGSTMEVLFSRYIFKSPIRALAMGTLVTVLVQSSSVSISIMIPLAGAGIVTLNQIFPYVIGANVGTTITAILAALSLGSVAGIAIAFAHLLFNVVGAAVWYPARIVPIRLAQYFTKLALINKAIPILIILFVYILLPLMLIMIFR